MKKKIITGIIILVLCIGITTFLLLKKPSKTISKINNSKIDKEIQNIIKEQGSLTIKTNEIASSISDLNINKEATEEEVNNFKNNKSKMDNLIKERDINGLNTLYGELTKYIKDININVENRKVEPEQVIINQQENKKPNNNSSNQENNNVVDKFQQFLNKVKEINPDFRIDFYDWNECETVGSRVINNDTSPYYGYWCDTIDYNGYSAVRLIPFGDNGKDYTPNWKKYN